QTIKIPAEDVARCLAIILEARGGPAGGPHLSMSIDLLVRGTPELAQPVEAGEVQAIVTPPEAEEGIADPARARIACAAREALTMRRPKRYAAWREIVV